jgi:crossover junction endodeoxyribonuclease RuvC
MRVLGVDPGLTRTGWAAVESRADAYHVRATGLIAPSARAELPQRLADGFAAFAKVLADVEPEVVVLEDLYSASGHPRAALLMAHMRGVICLAVGQQGIRVEPMTATTVKQRLTGNGHASKSQVQGMVLRLCDISAGDMRADVSDAIALAVAGLHQAQRGSLPNSRLASSGPRSA